MPLDLGAMHVKMTRLTERRQVCETIIWLLVTTAFAVTMVDNELLA